MSEGGEDMSTLAERLQQRNIDVDQRFANLDTQMAAQRLEMATNTAMTVKLGERIEQLDQDTLPVRNAVATMEKGVHYIGRAGDFIGTWGKRIYHGMLVVVGFVVVYAIYQKGGGFFEMAEAMLRVLTGGPH